MTKLRSLIRLQTWLSPAFPTGSFSYSHGLEAAISNHVISNKEDLSEWLRNLLSNGPGWNDAVLLAEAWRRATSGEKLEDIVELGCATSLSRSRFLETTAQGDAFLAAAKAWCKIDLPEECPLPVAVGAVAGALDIELEETLTAYLHAYVSNQIQAALRLMKLGQQGGVELLHSLETNIIEMAHVAMSSTLDDLGTSSFMADVAALQHDALESRIFRS